MGPTAALVAATAISAGAQAYGGYSQYKSSMAEASQLQQQGALQQQDAQFAAGQKAWDVQHEAANQGHIYLSSGVTMAGTPAQVLQDTYRRGQQEVNALTRRGNALRSLANQQAVQTRNSGRDSFISGILGAGATAAGGYYKLKTPYAPVSSNLTGDFENPYA